MGKIKSTREVRKYFEVSVYEIELYFNLWNTAKFYPRRKFRFLKVYSKRRKL